jgi:hypothetical protein
MAKGKVTLSPIGTTEPKFVGAGFKPALDGISEDRAGLKPAPTLSSLTGLTGGIGVVGAGDESPAYYQNVHPGCEKPRY